MKIELGVISYVPTLIPHCLGGSRINRDRRLLHFCCLLFNVYFGLWHLISDALICAVMVSRESIEIEKVFFPVGLWFYTFL